MDSYVKLKKELESLQNKNDELQKQKSSILMPIYKLIDSHKETLSGILPKNINSYDSDILILRLTVLEDETISLIKDQNIQKEILSILKETKNKIIEKNKEQKEIKEKINELEPELAKRKNYVIEKQEEIEKIDSQVKEYQDKIASHIKALDENQNLELEIRTAIQRVIDEYWKKLRTLESKKQTMLKENNLEDDIIELKKEQTQKEQEVIKKSNISSNYPDIYQVPIEYTIEKIDSKSQNMSNHNIGEIPISSKVSTDDSEISDFAKYVEEASTDELANFLHMPNDRQSIQLSDSNTENISEEVQEPTIIFKMPHQEESKVMLPAEEEQQEEQYDVISSYKNTLLEKKIKLEKRLRVMLGTGTLALKHTASDFANKISTIKETKEKSRQYKKTIEKSHDLILQVRNLIDNHFSQLTQEEVDSTVLTASKIARILKKVEKEEPSYDDDIILELNGLNTLLARYLEQLYQKKETVNTYKKR